jgi:hypothetical protein
MRRPANRKLATSSVIERALCEASPAERQIALLPATKAVDMSLLQFKPSSAHTPARPPCPKCAGKMIVTLIRPLGRSIDQRSFECGVCDYVEVIMFVSH